MLSICETHWINMQNNGSLEISYSRQHEKISLEKISFIAEGRIFPFEFTQVWFNGQPAKCIKGFKAELIGTRLPIQAEIVEENLHLSASPHHCQLSQSVEINVQHGTDSYPFSVSPNLKVKGLYELVKNALNHSDFTLCDEHGYPLEKSKTLEGYGITAGTILTVEIHQKADRPIREENRGRSNLEKGMGVDPLRFVNFEQEQGVGFGRAPAWRTITRGLSLEGKCKNGTCAAFNQLVCVPKGMGVFHMSMVCATAGCPSCHTVLAEVINCFFWDCVYSIEGHQQNHPEQFHLENRVAPKDRAISFETINQDQNHSNIVDWGCLRITTIKAPFNLCIIL